MQAFENCRHSFHLMPSGIPNCKMNYFTENGKSIYYMVAIDTIKENDELVMEFQLETAFASLKGTQGGGIRGVRGGREGVMICPSQCFPTLKGSFALANHRVNEVITFELLKRVEDEENDRLEQKEKDADREHIDGTGGEKRCVLGGTEASPMWSINDDPISPNVQFTSLTPCEFSSLLQTYATEGQDREHLSIGQPVYMKSLLPPLSLPHLPSTSSGMIQPPSSEKSTHSTHSTSMIRMGKKSQDSESRASQKKPFGPEDDGDDDDSHMVDHPSPEDFDLTLAMHDFFSSPAKKTDQNDASQNLDLEAKQIETFQSLFSQFCHHVQKKKKKRVNEEEDRKKEARQAIEAFLTEQQLEVCIVTGLKDIARGTELKAEYSMNHDWLESFGVLKPPEILLRYYETDKERFNVGVFDKVDLNDETDVVTLSWAPPYDEDEQLCMSKADYIANRLVRGRTLPRPWGGFDSMEFGLDLDELDVDLDVDLDQLDGLDVDLDDQTTQETRDDSSDDLPTSKGKSGYKGVYPIKKRFKCRITINSQHNQDPFDGKTFASALEAAKALRDWRLALAAQDPSPQ